MGTPTDAAIIRFSAHLPPNDGHHLAQKPPGLWDQCACTCSPSACLLAVTWLLAPLSGANPAIGGRLYDIKSRYVWLYIQKRRSIEHVDAAYDQNVVLPFFESNDGHAYAIRTARVP